MFRDAYELVYPHLPEIHRPGTDYYTVMKRAGQMKRIDELSSQARAVLGEQVIYRRWAAYAREHPDQVFID